MIPWKPAIAVLVLVPLATFVASSSSPHAELLPPEVEDERAPYQLHGTIKDTVFTFEKADDSIRDIYPLVKDLLETEAFRYYKIDLYRDCPFWNEHGVCLSRDCAVETTEDDRVKQMWNNVDLGAIESTSLQKDSPYRGGCQDEGEDKDFCVVEDDSSDGVYVDLLKSPERYTGYSGESAHRVWNNIYEQNCFRFIYGDRKDQEPVRLTNSVLPPVEDLCLEKRAFYQVISGLHSSISIHLCEEYLFKSTGTWGPNLDCFHSRVGSHKSRLRNVYFLYAIILQAIDRAGRHLDSKNYCTGKDYIDQSVEVKMRKLRNTLAEVGPFFDRSAMFVDEMAELKTDFKTIFRNISMIMRCVSCEKCRLWGTVQVNGIGTALKLLFSYDELDPQEKIHLQRSELIALYNVFGRVSESIMAIENFRKLYLARYQFLLNSHAMPRRVVMGFARFLPANMYMSMVEVLSKVSASLGAHLPQWVPVEDLVFAWVFAGLPMMLFGFLVKFLLVKRKAALKGTGTPAAQQTSASAKKQKKRD